MPQEVSVAAANSLLVMSGGARDRDTLLAAAMRRHCRYYICSNVVIVVSLLGHLLFGHSFPFLPVSINS